MLLVKEISQRMKDENKTCLEISESFPMARKNEDNTKWSVSSSVFRTDEEDSGNSKHDLFSFL